MSNQIKTNRTKIFFRSLWITLAGGLALLVYLIILAQDLPSLEQLENYDPDLVSCIYSSDGEILHELFLQKRVFVELDSIPQLMVN